jgi:hypothetical protein
MRQKYFTLEGMFRCDSSVDAAGEITDSSAVSSVMVGKAASE